MDLVVARNAHAAGTVDEARALDAVGFRAGDGHAAAHDEGMMVTRHSCEEVLLRPGAVDLLRGELVGSTRA